MKILTYTRYLKQKIKFYDRLLAQNMQYKKNPFAYNKQSTTVVWIEDDDNEM